MLFNKTPVRGLIFDMDGVLIDSEPLHLLAYQEVLATMGIAYAEEDNRELLGRKELDCAKILIKRYNLRCTPEELVREKESIMERLLKTQSNERPGVSSILSAAKNLGLPMAVASSATLATINLVVDILSIRPFFKALASGEEVKHGKPAPDVFILAAERIGVDPTHCLVIEDTFNGVVAAKAAGMQCIAIPCEATRHQDHSQADAMLTSLTELQLEDWCPANS